MISAFEPLAEVFLEWIREILWCMDGAKAVPRQVFNQGWETQPTVDQSLYSEWKLRLHSGGKPGPYDPVGAHH